MHEPVLLEETVKILAVKPGGIYVDGTVGSGGHARAIADRMEGRGQIVGIDRDPQALDRAEARLRDVRVSTRLLHGDFGDLKQLLNAHGIDTIDGLLLDLGMSSDQVDTAERGFSFAHDGALDMRMNPADGTTAEDLVNNLSEDALHDLFRGLGEERRAGRIATAIVRERRQHRIARTQQLADLVARAVGGRRGRIHPATRIFQALRMEVNHELRSLERGLAQGLEALRPGGRMAVIAFHSLEDRMVKHTFAAHAGKWVSLPEGGRRRELVTPEVTVLTRKPLTASTEELKRNPRARSAKLRAAERIGAPNRNGG